MLRLRQQGRYQRAIFFGGAESALPEPPWDVAFRISADEYQGEIRLQMQVEALRSCGNALEYQMALPLETSLGEITWIPRPRLTQLRRLELETVGDLLRHYPRRHEDRREFAGFPREESDQPICLCGEVTKTQIKRFGGWKKIFEVTLEEDAAHALSQPLVLRWFNLHYVQKMIATGQRLVVFGKPRLRGKRLCMEHPEFEVIENDEEISIHFRRITPIYPATEGLLAAGFARDDLPARWMEHDAGDGISRRRLREHPFSGKLGVVRQSAREPWCSRNSSPCRCSSRARRARSRARSGGAHCGKGELLERFLDARCRST